jgi:hypothetical protein
MIDFGGSAIPGETAGEAAVLLFVDDEEKYPPNHDDDDGAGFVVRLLLLLLLLPPPPLPPSLFVPFGGDDEMAFPWFASGVNVSSGSDDDDAEGCGILDDVVVVDAELVVTATFLEVDDLDVVGVAVDVCE